VAGVAAVMRAAIVEAEVAAAPPAAAIVQAADPRARQALAVSSIRFIPSSPDAVIIMTVVANTPGATKVAGIMLARSRGADISLIGGIT
jgi:hypothetical protein